MKNLSFILDYNKSRNLQLRKNINQLKYSSKEEFAVQMYKLFQFLLECHSKYSSKGIT